MRLDKYLADAAALTRGEARKLIKAGALEIDGVIVKDAAMHVCENVSATLNGKKLRYNKYVYIMLNKPKGYVSSTEDKRHKTVLDLIDSSYERYSLFPVGRLDIDTEGFLLLTNDGALAHNVLAPNKVYGKTYYVLLEKNITDEQIRMLSEGVNIGECITRPASLRRMSDHEIELTITEGKFHQIKRMAHAISNNVIYLKRLAYGNLYLDDSLLPGQYRHLTEEEVNNIYNVYKRK